MHQAKAKKIGLTLYKEVAGWIYVHIVAYYWVLTGSLLPFTLYKGTLAAPPGAAHPLNGPGFETFLTFYKICLYRILRTSENPLNAKFVKRAAPGKWSAAGGSVPEAAPPRSYGAGSQGGAIPSRAMMRRCQAESLTGAKPRGKPGRRPSEGVEGAPGLNLSRLWRGGGHGRVPQMGDLCLVKAGPRRTAPGFFHARRDRTDGGL